MSSTSVNEITGEKQHVAGMTPDKEIALGLNAAPEMLRQFGGESHNAEATELVDFVGRKILRTSDAGRSPYRFQFHLLADRQTINAFALPGGQVFITEALLSKLQTNGQLAGVLGHEIGHVVARHGAEYLAKAQLTQGLTGAAVLATYDPENPSSMARAAMIQMIGGMVNMKFGRDDELESDKLGVRFMAQAGYDPRSMIDVMKVLKEAGGAKTPEFFSTHPNPDNRIQKIERAIKDQFPNGLRGALEP